MEERKGGRVHLTGHIDIPLHLLNSVRLALPRHIALTRQEDGCLSFEVVESDAIPGRFLVSEIFLNQAAFEAHQVRTKNSEWYEITSDIPRHFSVTTEESDT